MKKLLLTMNKLVVAFTIIGFGNLTFAKKATSKVDEVDEKVICNRAAEELFYGYDSVFKNLDHLFYAFKANGKLDIERVKEELNRIIELYNKDLMPHFNSVAASEIFNNEYKPSFHRLYIEAKKILQLINAPRKDWSIAYDYKSSADDLIKLSTVINNLNLALAGGYFNLCR